MSTKLTDLAAQLEARPGDTSVALSVADELRSLSDNGGKRSPGVRQLSSDDDTFNPNAQRRVFDPASGRMLDDETRRLVDTSGQAVGVEKPMYENPQVCDPVIGNDGEDAVMRGDPRITSFDNPESDEDDSDDDEDNVYDPLARDEFATNR